MGFEVIFYLFNFNCLIVTYIYLILENGLNGEEFYATFTISIGDLFGQDLDGQH